MKNLLAFAAGAAACFAAAFCALEIFGMDTLIERKFARHSYNADKMISIFGFKDKKGDIFVEICQIADTAKDGESVLDRGGLLKMKKKRPKELFYRGSEGCMAAENLSIIRQTYYTKDGSLSKLALQASDFEFTPAKEGEPPIRYPLEVPSKYFPLTIE